MYILKKMANYIILFIYQSLIKRSSLSLCYHIASDEEPIHIKHLYAFKTLKMFESDLLYLKQHYDLQSYNQFKEINNIKVKTEKIPLLLTFDDGFSECFSSVRPLLLEYKVPCTFFITTDFIDNKSMFYRNKVSLCIEKLNTIKHSKLMDVINVINNSFNKSIRDRISFITWINSLLLTHENIIDEICTILELDIEEYLAVNKPYLTSEEIKRLALDGFTIGSHSKDHNKLELLSHTEIEKNIVDSCRIIMDLTKTKKVPFAFPYSGSKIEPNFLKYLISKYDFLDFLFDIRGMKKDENFIFNRVVCDVPSMESDNQSNIPTLLLKGYYVELKRMIKTSLILS